jgi:hypothetical protein
MIIIMMDMMEVIIIEIANDESAVIDLRRKVLYVNFLFEPATQKISDELSACDTKIADEFIARLSEINASFTAKLGRINTKLNGKLTAEIKKSIHVMMATPLRRRKLSTT